MEEQEIGKVTHYFNHLSVAIIKLSKSLSSEDTIHIKGHTSDFSQKADSMQMDHEPIDSAKKGKVIGIKVKDPARVGDAVYKVSA